VVTFWTIAGAVWATGTVVLLLMLAWTVRRDPACPDPVDEAYADTGMVLRGELLDVERLRELAAADGQERAEMKPWLIAIYRYQFDAHYGRKDPT